MFKSYRKIIWFHTIIISSKFVSHYKFKFIQPFIFIHKIKMYISINTTIDPTIIGWWSECVIKWPLGSIHLNFNKNDLWEGSQVFFLT